MRSFHEKNEGEASEKVRNIFVLDPIVTNPKDIPFIKTSGFWRCVCCKCCVADDVSGTGVLTQCLNICPFKKLATWMDAPQRENPQIYMCPQIALPTHWVGGHRVRQRCGTIVCWRTVDTVFRLWCLSWRRGPRRLRGLIEHSVVGHDLPHRVL